MSASICFIASSGTLSFSITFESLSNILIAYHLCSFSGISCKTASSMWAIACSTAPENVCIGTVFPVLAALIASSAASITPSFFSADISTILHPRFLESSAMFILSPFFLTTSIMLIATTTGMPSSVNWVVR